MSDQHRPGLMLYFDLRPAIQRLNMEQRGALLTAILDYAELGELPTDLDDLTGMAFDFLRPRLERDASRYESKKAQQQYASYCAGCKRRGETAQSFDEWIASVGYRSESDGHRPDTGRHPTTTSTTTATTSSTPTTNGTRTEPDPPPPFRDSPALQKAFDNWLAYKTERREPYRAKGLESLISQIRKAVERHGEAAVIDLIELCMASGWRSIIFERLEKQDDAQPVSSEASKKQKWHLVSDL